MDGASLFSLGNLFPGMNECLDAFMGFDKETNYGDGYQQVIKGDGRIQKSLGKILQSLGESVYVDARRDVSSPSSLFEYSSSSSEDDNLPVHHFSEDPSGDCLTFVSEAGSLVTRGIDCSTKKKPLCLKVDSVNSEELSNMCEACSEEGSGCIKWATLGELEASLPKTSLCVAPCDKTKGKHQKHCKVSF